MVVAPDDKSNGYEEVEETFMKVRDTLIGPTTVRKWSQPNSAEARQSSNSDAGTASFHKC